VRDDVVPDGLNAKQVQLWLGHHSPAFTLATYVHLLPDDLPEVAFLDDVVALDERGHDGAIRPTEIARDERVVAAAGSAR
jgi:hypothetical protein